MPVPLGLVRGYGVVRGENAPNIELYCDGSHLSLLQPTLLNNPRTVSELYRDGAHSYIPGKNYIRVHYLEL